MPTLENPFIEKALRRNPFIEKARQADAEIDKIDSDVGLPDTTEGMLALLSRLSDDELQEMFEAQEELERRLAEFGPQDDDELHAWIKAELRIDVPRSSVCENHDPPFKFIADLYFERVDATLAMANRGGGKTMLVAILHWVNSLFKHGCESCTFGATEAQSLRCYAYIKGWVYNDKGDRRPEVISSLMRETVFTLGSRIEVLPGTPQAVNGPHPQKAHADEIELMDDGTFSESRNMTMSKTLIDGKVVRAQDILTSTRKGPNGRMQKLIDEITFAINAGYKPPRTLYQWCIKETASQVLNCQVANPDLPLEKRCQCNMIRKGEWEDGKPRLLRDICNGDFYKSRGWQPFDDVIKQFTENDQETFEVQQLCLKPELRWHYLPKFVDEEPRYCFRNYDADPNNGPIYTSTDWGGCYDAKTEVLTQRGWVKWPDVKSDDHFASLDPQTERVEYQQASEIIAKPYRGFLQSWNNRSVDLLVTADHNMLVKDMNDPDSDWRLTPSFDVPNSSRMLKTSAGRNDESEWAPNGIDPEVWAAFLGLWMAEGHTHLGRMDNGSPRKTGIVGFTIPAKDLREELEELITPYFKHRWNETNSQLIINEPWLYEHLSEFGKAGDKYLPEYVKRWPQRLLKIYLEWHMRGDGNWSPHTTHGGTYVSQRLGRIYTGSKHLADDLQEIAMYAGWAAHVSCRDPRDSVIDGRLIKANLHQYCVGFTERRVRPQVYAKPGADSVRKTLFAEKPVMVYCAVLPKWHTLYVRRNGKAVWCGNTNPHSVHWYQFLKFEIEVDMYTVLGAGVNRMRIPQGSIICFDEIYRAEIGNTRLGQLVQLKEAEYVQKWGRRWRVAERFADPQGKAARKDWRDMGLKTSWHVTREFEEHIKVITDLFDANQFYVAADKCPMWVREAREWRRKPDTGQQLDIFNHCFIAGTPVLTHRGEIPIENVQEGDFVQTRAGLKRVTASGVTGFEREFIRLCIDGRIVTCTPNHLIYTKNMGWNRADHITAGTVVLGIFPKSNGAVLSFANTKKDDITERFWDQPRIIFGSISTEKFGNFTSDLFQKAMKCITNLRMIKRRLIRRDLIFGLRPSIEVIMPMSGGLPVAIETSRGIGQQLVPALLSGSKNTNVSAVKNSNDLTMAELVVENVEHVALPRQPVYDLTVEEQHEFYAGGILVHNCMSDFRYGVANICQIHKSKVGTFESIPVVDPTERQSQVTISVRREAPGPLGFSSSGEDEFSQWRNNLGEPVKRNFV